AHKSGEVKLTGPEFGSLINQYQCCGPIARAITAPGNIDITAGAGSITKNADDFVNLSGANVALTAGSGITPFGNITANAGNVLRSAERRVGKKGLTLLAPHSSK